MQDDSGQRDYKRETERLEKLVAVKEREVAFQLRVIDVLVAVGHVSRPMVEKAREIVSSFD